MHQQHTAFENIMGKEEIARNEQFLLFPQYFLLNQKIIPPFINIFDIISLFATELEEPKIGISVKGLSCLCGLCRLILSQTTNFGLFQIQRVCRRQFQM